MPSPSISRLRAALAALGLTTASWIPEGSEGRAEEATVQPARLVEGHRVEALPVGEPEAWPDTVAFLDGTQRYEIVAYVGTAPILVADIAAAVRERRGRRLRTVAEARRTLAIGRPAALDAAAPALDGYEAVPLSEEKGVHPVQDFQAARKLVDAARGRLEVTLGEAYRREAPGWLVVDGSLAESTIWAADARTIGISKSHATLPFAGEDQERYLKLPYAHRSPVFAPASRSFAPVYAWALRLWPWEGKDLFHGLIRVEAAPTPETIAAADAISRWLLAERAPVSTPDPRWDRLLYGIYSVEQYLKVSGRR